MNLGSYIDDKLSLNSHINKVCNASFYYLHNIGLIRKHLSRDSSETLIHAFVSSRLDYCNSLLYGLPQVHFDKIQRVQSAAARLIFEQPKFCQHQLCFRFQAARYSQQLMVEHSVMRPQSSGTTNLAKYPVLTLCQIFNANM